MEVAIRRVRRTDFTAVCRLAANADLPVPAPERATLRRFRRMVADLGSDLYVASENSRPVGFIHVSYTRDLLSGCRGYLVALLSERESIGELLLRTANDRAKRRGCQSITVIPGPWTSSVGEITGLGSGTNAGGIFEVDVRTEPGTE